MSGYLQSSMSKDYQKKYGDQRKKNLVYLREQVANMSLSRFAADIGIAKGNISGIENCERNLSAGNIQSYKKYFSEKHNLEVSVDFILGYTDIVENKSASLAEDLGLTKESLDFIIDMSEEKKELFNRLCSSGIANHVLNVFFLYAYGCSYNEITIKHNNTGSVETISDPSEATSIYREKIVDDLRVDLKAIGKLYEKDRKKMIEQKIETLKTEISLLKL